MGSRTPGPIVFPYLVMQIIKQGFLVILYVVAPAATQIPPPVATPNSPTLNDGPGA